eukprot:jgi/Mesen1/185/ME1136459C07620
MGLLALAVTQALWLVHFPMWGGMLRPASKVASATEENYYASEYNESERAEGMHKASMKFADNARGERGRGSGLDRGEPEVEAEGGGGAGGEGRELAEV